MCWTGGITGGGHFPELWRNTVQQVCSKRSGLTSSKAALHIAWPRAVSRHKRAATARIAVLVAARALFGVARPLNAALDVGGVVGAGARDGEA